MRADGARDGKRKPQGAKRGRLLIGGVFAAAMILASCAGPGAFSAPPGDYGSLDEWLTREAVPFAADAPASFNPALDRVIADLGDLVELLGFGEALHGGEEILLLRNRIFRRLVEAHGYTAIAVESSFPRSRAVNDFIAGRGPDSYEVVREAGFSHGFGRLEANRELVEWMRDYNADPAHPVKLRFYGFDSPTEMTGAASPRTLLEFVFDCLAAGEPAVSRAYRERIEPLLGPDTAWENPAAMYDPAQSLGGSPAAAALRLVTEDLIAELAVRAPALAAGDGGERYAEAVHYATMARQLLDYHAILARPSGDRLSAGLGLRDAMMADNLAFIADRERGRGKLMVFAHNSHLKCGRAEWQLGPELLAWWPAGAQLATRFGSRYAVIGTAVGVSAANGLGSPEAGTLEARLTAGPGPARFVPTRRGLPAAELAALPTRSGSRKNPTYFPLTPRSVTEFDWLAVLDATSYTRGGSPLPGGE